jgi:hypothetical protein
VEFLLALAIIAVVAAFVTIPLRRTQRDDADPNEAELADLEARKEALYRAIRDAEADHAAGKLDDADFERLDRQARREAIDVLKRIDRLRPPGSAGGGSGAAEP